MKKKSIFLIITIFFLMNTVTTTENCITGFACKINQINEEKKQTESAIQKEIQKDSKKDMHNLNIRKNAENKMIKNDKKNLY